MFNRTLYVVALLVFLLGFAGPTTESVLKVSASGVGLFLLLILVYYKSEYRATLTEFLVKERLKKEWWEVFPSTCIHCQGKRGRCFVRHENISPQGVSISSFRTYSLKRDWRWWYWFK